MNLKNVTSIFHIENPDEMAKKKLWKWLRWLVLILELALLALAVFGLWLGACEVTTTVYPITDKAWTLSGDLSLVTPDGDWYVYPAERASSIKDRWCLTKYKCPCIDTFELVGPCSEEE